MRIYKKLNADFTVTSNEIFRHGLSLKAIGLYLYIVNKPDGWIFSLEGVASQVADGIDSVRAGVRELEKAGFLGRSRDRLASGKLGASSWVVSDRPLENPIKTPEETLEKPTLENPTLVKPTLEKPTLEKPPQVNTKEVNTNLSNDSPTGNDVPSTVAEKPKGGVEKTAVNHGVVIDGSRSRKAVVNDRAGKVYGNAYVAELMDYFKVRLEVPVMDDSIPRNRQFCWNLMRKFGKGPDGKFSQELGRDKVRMLIDQAAESDFYRYKITSMWKLWIRAVEIMSSPRNRRGEVTTLER